MTAASPLLAPTVLDEIAAEAAPLEVVHVCACCGDHGATLHAVAGEDLCEVCGALYDDEEPDADACEDREPWWLGGRCA